MGIGIDREEYEEEANAFAIAADALYRIRIAESCDSASGCTDIAYKALKEIQWLSEIDPDQD